MDAGVQAEPCATVRDDCTLEVLVRVRDVAALLGAAFEGQGDHEIHSCAALEDARPQDLAFVGSSRTMSKAAKQAATSQAGCLLVPEDFDNAQQRTLTASYDVADLQGAAPAVEVGGWNVAPQTLTSF